MSNGPQYAKGAYSAVIISQALGEAATGTPQFSFRFRLEETGDERTCYIALTEGSMEFAVQDLKRLGFDKNSLRYLDPNIAGFQSFSGQSVEMYCKHDTYKGNTNEKWNISRPLKAREFESRPVEQSKLRNLDNLFGHAMKTSGPKPAARLPQPDAGLGVNDDDVPF